MVVNTFGWQRVEVVQLNTRERGDGEEANMPKRARLEQNIQMQMLHDGSEIGLYFSLILCMS